MALTPNPSPVSTVVFQKFAEGLELSAFAVYNVLLIAAFRKKGQGWKILAGLLLALEFWWLTIGSNGLLFQSMAQSAQNLFNWTHSA